MKVTAGKTTLTAVRTLSSAPPGVMRDATASTEGESGVFVPPPAGVIC